MTVPRVRLVLAMVVVACVFLLARSVSAADAPAPDVTEPPKYEEFLVIPLRVHVLSSDDLPEVDCRLSDDDVRRIIGKVNGVWNKAGVHWGLESIVREPASRQKRFRVARDLLKEGAPLELFRVLIPEEPSSRSFDGLHVYYIHKFPVNGVYMGEDFAIVQETAKLREVDGGIDEPVPRVTAHELAHALGLPHRQDRTNLLASGTTGTLLNEKEVSRAREQARKTKGALSVSDLRKKAEKAAAKSRVDDAKKLWTWLSEIPGEGAAEARRRLDSLGSEEELKVQSEQKVKEQK